MAAQIEASRCPLIFIEFPSSRQGAHSCCKIGSRCIAHLHGRKQVELSRRGEAGKDVQSLHDLQFVHSLQFVQLWLPSLSDIARIWFGKVSADVWKEDLWMVAKYGRLLRSDCDLEWKSSICLVRELCAVLLLPVVQFNVMEL